MTTLEKNAFKVLSYLKTLDFDKGASEEVIMENTGITRKELFEVFQLYPQNRDESFFGGGAGFLYITSMGKNHLEKIFQADEKDNLEIIKLRSEVELIGKQIKDYEEIKGRSKNANLIAILAIVVSTLSMILQLKGCIID